MTMVAQGPGLHEIARGVYAWIGPEGRTNAGFIVWDDGVIVVDSLYGTELAQGLTQHIRSVTDRPIRYVIDTHEHWDHCYANQYFVPAVFVGHDNCRRGMVERPEHGREFGISMMLARGLPAIAEEFRQVTLLPPVVTYADSMALYAGERRVELRYLGRAHTDGDTIVWLPEERIAFTGDLFVSGRSPYAGDGYPRAWIGALGRLAELPTAVIVPGHGDLATQPEIGILRTWMERALAAIQEGRARGLSAEQAKQQLQIAVPEGWPNPQAGADFVEPFYRELAAG